MSITKNTTNEHNTMKLIHTRTEAEATVLKSKGGHKGRSVVGLTEPTKTALIKAALKGNEIITNGLPLDFALSLGPVTLQRAWSTEKSDGVRDPQRVIVLQIANEEAFAELQKSDAYKTAIVSEEEEEEEEL